MTSLSTPSANADGAEAAANTALASSAMRASAGTMPMMALTARAVAVAKESKNFIVVT
jgi:hypothetical protein